MAKLKSGTRIYGSATVDTNLTVSGDGFFSNIALYDDISPSHYLTITNSANLTATRTLSVNVNDADRTISLSGNLTVSSASTISGTNTGDQTITLTGDVTGSGTGSFATTIANSAVTYAKIQNVSATDRLLGRSTAGAGVIEEITCTGAGRALLDDVDATAQRSTLGLGTIATQLSNNVSITGGSITGITDIALADGGTNASLTASAGSVVYSTATGMAFNTAGTSGQVLTSGGTGAPTWTNFSFSSFPDEWVKARVVAATTADLGTVTYSNGASGVGATLTGPTGVSAVVFPSQDGQTISLNDRILVKDQTNAAHNGIYTLTTVGVAGTTAWVLTRAVDADTNTQLAGSTVFVDRGTTNGGTLWTNTLLSTSTVGSSAVNYRQIVNTTSTQTLTNKTLTSPVIDTQITTSSASFDILNTTATTVNAFGAATTLALGYSGSTTSSTTNISTGSTTTGTTRTINIGTGSLNTGGTLNINLATNTNSASTSTITLGATLGTSRTIIQTATTNIPYPVVIGSFANEGLRGPITALLTSSAGSGYRDGVHDYQLTGGTGSGAIAKITFGGGQIRGVISAPVSSGTGYTSGDTLTLLSTQSAGIATTAATGDGTNATLSFAAQTQLATVSTTGNGTTATITFATQVAAVYPIGSTITVSGVTPAGYNGTYVVTGAATNSVSYANATTGAQTVAGTVSIHPFVVGANLVVSGVTPAGYNGTYTVVSSTATSVTYANATTGAQTVAGAVSGGSPLTTGSVSASSVRIAGLQIQGTSFPCLRIEDNNTTLNTGINYAGIAFSTRDNTVGAAGDKALIISRSEDSSGGTSLLFYTSASASEAKLCASFGSTKDFRLYDSTSTYYHSFANEPTANRTLTVPDATGTFVLDSFTQTLTNKTLTSPVIDTQITTNSTTVGLFDATATTINAFGGATTINLGYDLTTNTSSTINIATVGTTTGTKNINIGTGGNGSSSITNVNLGSVNVNAKNTTTIGGATTIFPNKVSATGGVVSSSLTTAGSGFRDGVYTLSSTIGNGILAVISVGGGIIRSYNFNSAGYGHLVGDTISIASAIATTNVITTAATGNGTTATLTFNAQSSLATTGASGTGTAATLTFATQTYAPYPVGSQITVSGVTPAGYNGTYTVTACTTTSVTYANATTGAQTVAGTISIIPFVVGSSIQVSSILPAGYQGVYTVTGCTATTVSYANTTTGAQTTTGSIWSANVSAASILVTDVASAGLTIINDSTETGYPCSRLRLENRDISGTAGKELGTIAFAGRDGSNAASGDRALIRGVYTDTTGASSIEFWTSASSTTPILQASFGATGDFRLFDSTSTYYASISTSPTANRTITIPDAAGAIVLDIATQTLTNKTLTSPVINTSITTASSTVGLFDTTALTVNAFGETTSLNIGYDGTASSNVTNISVGAITAGTKTINIGTGGAAGSTDTINIGSANTAGTTTISTNLVAAKQIQRSGNYSRVLWTTVGVALDSATSTFTDTSGSGAITTRVANSFNTPTFASSNIVTVTDAATVYISNAPTAGTNTTIDNSWAMIVDNGPIRADGGLTIANGSILPTRGPINNISITAGGTGYTDGTYTDVPLSGGFGFGATATLTVSGGAVTVATLTRGGNLYKASDVLSAISTVGGFGNGTGSGLSLSISSVSSADILVSNQSPPVIRINNPNTSVSADSITGGIHFSTLDNTLGGAGDKVKLLAVTEGLAAGGYLRVDTAANAGESAVALHVRGDKSIRLFNSAGTFYTSITHGATANRTISIPDATGTFVVDAATQTLTNKTLTSPVIDTQITTNSASVNVFDTTATTVNAFGATTTLALGYDSTATSTTNICNGTSSAGTKTINIGTNGTGTEPTVGTFVNIGTTSGGASTFSQIDLNGAVEISASDRSSRGPVTNASITTAGSGFKDGVYGVTISANGLHYVIGYGGGIARDLYIVGSGFGLARNDQQAITHNSAGTTGGSGNGTTVTLTTSGVAAIATTSGSGSGTNATITFAAQTYAPFPIGSKIVVSGVTPAGYNGTYTVVACTTTSVTYANATTGAVTVNGNIQIIQYVVGSSITVAGFTPAGFNGTYTVTASTPTSVSYANATTGTATVNGNITTTGTTAIITVNTATQAALYLSNLTSTTPTSRVRLENVNSSPSVGVELGSIMFSSKNISTSTTLGSAGGDRAIIRGTAQSDFGDTSIDFLTSGQYGLPTISASFGSGKDFKLYNSAGTFYSSIATSATANRTLTIPDAAGTFVLQSGGLITNVNGMTFPAAQVSSADANTLDDYEEGTFTPALAGTTVAGAGTYSIQTGSYTKVGNRVFFNLYMVWSAHTGTGNMKVTGLPFTAAILDASTSPCSAWTNTMAMTASNVLQTYVLANSSEVTITQIPTGGGTSASIAMDTAATLLVSGQYRT